MYFLIIVTMMDEMDSSFKGFSYSSLDANSILIKEYTNTLLELDDKYEILDSTLNLNDGEFYVTDKSDRLLAKGSIEVIPFPSDIKEQAKRDALKELKRSVINK